MPGSVTNQVRQRRLAAGMSQQILADQAGVARQAIHAIETGRYLPNTLVALRLAQVLQCRVESLFALPEAPARVQAELPQGLHLCSGSPERVFVAQVGGRTLAYPLSGSADARTAADGLASGGGPGVDVELLIDARLIEQTVVICGCDPALALLGVHLSRRHPTIRLVWRQGNSMAALRALARAEVHAAGVHLRDPQSGVSNLPYVTRELPGQAVAIVGLCDWQQGLLLAAGNPKGIRSAADLCRPDVRIVSREPGSGSRLLLDAWLAAGGVPEQQGQWEVGSHFAVGEALASGAADVGPGILSVARALSLDFLPLQEEPYDLVIPAPYFRSAAVQALLDVAVSAPYRRELAALGGYDSRRTGTIVAELAA